MSSLPSRTKTGRRKPPHEGLLGRAAVARSLPCDPSHLRYLETTGKLVPAFRDPDGSRWYAAKDVLAFAVIWNETRVKRAEKKALKEQKAKKATKAAAIAPVSPDYDPDPMRRGAAKASTTTKGGVRTGSPAPASSAAPAPEALYEPAPAAHAVPAGRSENPPTTPPPTAPKRTVESNWFSEEFKPDDGPLPQPTAAPKSRRLPTPIKKTIAFIDPRWFSDDYQPPPSER